MVKLRMRDLTQCTVMLTLLGAGLGAPAVVPTISNGVRLRTSGQEKY
jgi:hypothetical protein